jgi:flotillin
MLRAAADGLKGANLTVLDGAEGLSGVVASLAGQGMAVLDAVRNGLNTAAPASDDAQPQRRKAPAPALDPGRRSVAGQ